LFDQTFKHTADILGDFRHQEMKERGRSAKSGCAPEDLERAGLGSSASKAHAHTTL
jgi:hypothetical protein